VEPGAAVADHREEQVLDADVVMRHSAGDLFGRPEDAVMPESMGGNA
jgi:hypothetical protein